MDITTQLQFILVERWVSIEQLFKTLSGILKHYSSQLIDNIYNENKGLTMLKQKGAEL